MRHTAYQGYCGAGRSRTTRTAGCDAVDEVVEAELGSVGDERSADRGRVLLGEPPRLGARAELRPPQAGPGQVAGLEMVALPERAVDSDERRDRVEGDQLGRQSGGERSSHMEDVAE